ncbi:MAG: LamB/YcsF family protein, partial [Gammaproteobacteria bacterium]
MSSPARAIAGSTSPVFADLYEAAGGASLRAGDDDALLDVVTSANVACGFHAGDPLITRRVCAAAAARGVRIGAQVSYRDLAGFGRRFLDVALALTSRRYLAALQSYKSALARRNAALRDVARTGRGESRATVWEPALAEHGAVLWT